MTVQVAIARTRARITGDAADAAVVQRRLDALLAEALRAGVPDDAASGAVLCLPELRLRLRLTRAELDGPAAGRLWAEAIGRAIAAVQRGGGQGEGAWRFADARSYHAAYLRHRLGIAPAPDGLFTGMGALDLLTPLQALAEMAVADPALWSVLAPQGAAARLLSVIMAQAGAAGAVQGAGQGPGGAVGWLWTALARGDDRTGAPAADRLRVALRRLCHPDVAAALSAAGQDGGLSPAGRMLRALLCTAPLAPDLALTLARVHGALAVLGPGAQSLPQPALDAALRRAAVADPVAAALAPALLRLLRGGPQDAALIRRALSRQRSDPAPPPSRAAPVVQEAGTAAKAPRRAVATSRQSRHHASPHAGIGLLLPHLAEDGIGAAFGAATLRAACADLLRCDLFPAPQDDPFLLALIGTRIVDSPPERPGPRDLRLVAPASHAAIAAAKAGQDRLARWLIARFCTTLPGLAASSLAFVQRHFLHVPGEVWIDRDHVLLRLDPMPLLPVLQVAGRLGDDLTRLDWLQGQRLSIRCERAAS